MKFINNESDNFELLDFVLLSDDLIIEVLEMRNHPEVRVQMHSYNVISKNDHFLFIRSLKESDKNKYFLVKNRESFLGVIYFNNISFSDKKVTIGMYANLNNKVDGVGSLLMESILSVFYQSERLLELNLEVYESNYIAVGLYLKFGFVTYGSCFKENKKLLLMRLNKKSL